jgi:hypothetical protein
VDEGVAIVVAPLVPLSPVEGDQTYVVAPLAVRVADSPEQYEVLPEVVSAGTGFTVSVAGTLALVQV